jgi:glycosyltransferase involved in cell wall biosynthesis
MNSNTYGLVSVLMTAYNREKYIAQAIESVLHSSYINFELIILDDCSTDDTFNIAYHYQQKDTRIKLYKNEHNLGQFGNRNKAIALSSGVYIKFLDSDDELTVNGLEVMVKSMEQFPNAGIGVPVKEKYSNSLPYELTPHESVSLHYKGENHLCYGPTATIFTKKGLDAVDGFEEEYGILTDTLLNLKVASHFPTVLFEKNLFYWRRHDDQVTEEQKDNVRMIRERDVILKATMAYENLPLNEEEKKSILNNFVKINTLHFLNYLARGRFTDANCVRKDTELTLKKILYAILKK